MAVDQNSGAFFVHIKIADPPSLTQLNRAKNLDLTHALGGIHGNNI